VAVDFDGVIHAYGKGWLDGTIYDKPVPGAFSALSMLMDRYAVFIHTTRRACEVADWISERANLMTCWEPDGHPGCEFWNERGTLLVTDRKLPAVAYIDDRGIRFTSWDQALTDLAKFEPAR